MQHLPSIIIDDAFNGLKFKIINMNNGQLQIRIIYTFMAIFWFNSFPNPGKLQPALLWRLHYHRKWRATWTELTCPGVSAGELYLKRSGPRDWTQILTALFQQMNLPLQLTTLQLMH
jgi:hypothetical protein